MTDNNTDPLVDKITGRRMRKDSAYSTYGTYELWEEYQYEDGELQICSAALILKGQDPTKYHILDPEDKPRGEFVKLGEFVGNGLDARRWENEMLGFGEYTVFDPEFEDYYEDEDEGE